MKPAETASAYNQITHLWTSAKFDQSNGIEQHQKAISFTRKEGSAVDIGCGCTGRIIDLMLDSGFQTSGIDLSDEMIKLAKQRHPQVDFYQKDICDYQLPAKYDFISAWDSLWHIPLEQQAGVIGKLVDSLNPGGIFIFSFGGIAEASEHTNNAMGPEMYYSSLGTNGYLTLLIDLGCAIKHLEFDQHPESHAYAIVEKL
jgi:2-polyprenyl-3-methyl-5-hydroxy-6-metoxy-1,4-benzoquinol methylase